MENAWKEYKNQLQIINRVAATHRSLLMWKIKHVCLFSSTRSRGRTNFRIHWLDHAELQNIIGSNVKETWKVWDFDGSCLLCWAQTGVTLILCMLSHSQWDYYEIPSQWLDLIQIYVLFISMTAHCQSNIHGKWADCNKAGICHWALSQLYKLDGTFNLEQGIFTGGAIKMETEEWGECVDNGRDDISGL